MIEVQEIHEQIKSLEKLLESFRQMEIKEIENQIKNLEKVIDHLRKLKKDKILGELQQLLLNSEWPDAIDEEFICADSDKHKFERANLIIDFNIRTLVENKRFLDIGCGEGHVAKLVSERGSKVSVGYDIKENDKWKSLKGSEGPYFVSKLSDVAKHAPYDIILIDDVLDHIEGESPINLLKSAKGLLNRGGTIFLQCHPWCSRHGTHLYRKLNKAYIHLIFTEEELKEKEIFGLPTIKVIHPIMTYKKWIAAADLKIIDQSVTKEEAEFFFSETPFIAERIKAHWKESPEESLRSGLKFPYQQLSIQFIDYVLK